LPDPPPSNAEALKLAEQDLELVISKYLDQKTQLLRVESEVVHLREKVKKLKDIDQFDQSQDLDLAQLEDPVRDQEIREFRERLPALLALLENDEQQR
jgi:hypothetical protein